MPLPTVSSAATFTAVVLAGDRGPQEPLNQAAGVCCKAMVPIAGQPMLLRVLQALGSSTWVDERVIAGLPDDADSADAALTALLRADRLRRTPRGPGPSASAAAAVQTIDPQQLVLLTTADHALLRPEVVDAFLTEASDSSLDVAAAVIRYPGFHSAYPDMPKTVMRFSDDHYCGCNLFALLTPQGRSILDTWQQVEAQRKTPWKTVGLLGWGAVLRFLIGRLSLAQATRQLSRRLGLNVGVVILPYPDAAIDVDSVADWRFVQRIAGQTPPTPDANA